MYFFQFGRTAAVAAVRLAKERRVSKYPRLSLCGPNDREITAAEFSLPLQLICNPVEVRDPFRKTFPKTTQAPLPPPSPRAKTARGERERVYSSGPARAHPVKNKLLGGAPGPSLWVGRLRCPDLRQCSAEAH